MYECYYCASLVERDECGSWVDATGGDCCSGDENLVNENGVHWADVNAAHHDAIVASLERENEYWRAIHFPPKEGT